MLHGNSKARASSSMIKNLKSMQKCILVSAGLKSMLHCGHWNSVEHSLAHTVNCALALITNPSIVRSTFCRMNHPRKNSHHGVRHMHVVDGFGNPLDNKLRLQPVLKGINWIKPHQHCPRLPVTPMIMSSIQQALEKTP